MKTKEELAKEFEESKKWMEGGPKLWVQRTFIAGHEAAQRWISVDDELPQNITTVLVCGNSMRTTALFEDGFFYPDFGVVGSIITHWLPIPKLPTE